MWIRECESEIGKSGLRIGWEEPQQTSCLLGGTGRVMSMKWLKIHASDCPHSSPVPSQCLCRMGRERSLWVLPLEVHVWDLAGEGRIS